MISLLGALMVLTASPDAGTPPRKQLGEQFGVPVFEPDQPWTRQVPSPEGRIEKGSITQSSSADGTLRYDADRLTVSGTAAVELATKKLPSRRVSVQFKVDRGTVRVFLKYALDVAVYCEATAPASCTLEGVVWQSVGLRPMVLLQALDGEAVVSGFSAKSM